MRRFLPSFLLAALFALAVPSTVIAGGSDTFEGALPADVSGELLIEVSPEADEDGALYAYGTLTADGKQFAVEIPGAVLEAAALPAEGGAVTATFGEMTEEFGFPMYRVTALESK
jgi:hypothetical protein